MLTEAMFTAAFRAVEAFCVFLCTPEGQMQAAEWRQDREKLKADLAALGNWLKVGKP